MENMWYVYFLLFIALLLIYLPKKKRRRYVANRILVKNRIRNREGEEGNFMRELAERFIGKDVYVKLLDGTADGIVKEVTDNGIVLEYKDNQQVVNLDYVMKIREYPYKNGKRGTIWGE